MATICGFSSPLCCRWVCGAVLRHDTHSMQDAAIPLNEAQRMEALEALDVLDTGPEAELRVVNAAGVVCDALIALVSLENADRLRFKPDQVGVDQFQVHQ